VGLDDLDYLGVGVLAHRKVLMKGVEDLRNNGSFTLRELRAPDPSPSKLPHPDLQPPPSNGSGNKLVHWSQVDPINNQSDRDISEEEEEEENMRSTNERSQFDQGELDEEAERRAFQQAVMEWRNAGKTDSTNDTNNINNKENFDLQRVGGEESWSNPFTSSTSPSTTLPKYDNHHQPHDNQPQQEDDEDEMFKQAVEDWREGVTPSQRLATSLADQMEADYSERRSEMTKSMLDAKKELEGVKKEVEELKVSNEEMKSKYDQEEEEEEETKMGKVEEEEEDDLISEASSFDQHQEEMEDGQLGESKVDICLIQSIMGVEFDEKEGEDDYFVEEADY